MSGPAARARFRRDHRWVPAQLSDHLDGELTERSRRRIQRHVHDCPECRAALRGLERLLGLLHRLPATEPDTPDIVAGVRVRLARE